MAFVAQPDVDVADRRAADRAPLRRLLRQALDRLGAEVAGVELRVEGMVPCGSLPRW